MKYICVLALVLVLSSCSDRTTTLRGEDTAPTLVSEDLTLEETQTLTIENEAMIKNPVMGVEEIRDTMQKESLEKNNTFEAPVKSEVIESKDVTVQQEKVMQKTGIYTAYNPSLVGNTQSTVLFFHAAWCPSCRAADTGISAGAIAEGLTVLKVDYDSEIELKKKYEVTSQHTFVLVDADGILLRKWIGGTTIDSITEKLN